MNIESLEKVIDSMHDNKEQPKEELVLSFNNTVFRIKMNEIVYVKSEAHKTVIYMLDGIQSFYVSFKSICSQMPDYFYCINKGILVNMNYVKRIENSEVVMTYLEMKSDIHWQEIREKISERDSLSIWNELLIYIINIY